MCDVTGCGRLSSTTTSKKEELMLKEIEQRNQEIWAGHSRMLEDMTHVIGGIGIGILLYPALRCQQKPLGYTLLLISTALHCYADTVKPFGFSAKKHLS
jgi:hypothetical protein